MIDSDASSPTWIQAAIARTGDRLRTATATSDRLALLRENVRLAGGRLTMDPGTSPFAGLDRGLLGRFGIGVTPDGNAFMLIAPDHLERIDENLPLHLRADTHDRSAGLPAAPDAFLLGLSNHRRYKSLFQKACARAVMTMPPGAAMLATMPTGSGKSLLFQLLARHARSGDPHATIVVIVPTIALGLDHERTLRGYPGLEASRAMPSAADRAGRTAVRDAFRRGEVPVLFLSPECALGYAHEDILEAAKPPGTTDILLPYRLAAFVVDEAHIVEQWGRKFRPQFQRLSGLVRELRRRSPAIRTLLLSATLPPSARTMLRRDYLEGCESIEMKAGLPRYEFDLFTRAYADRAERDDAVVDLVDVLPRPAIVYTTTVAAAEHLHERLRTERGYRRIGLFTGRSTDDERQGLVDAWSEDGIDIMIATSAFGMGVDKQDVRAIVHACLPESPSRFYQEIGRAGRDGHQAFSFCLWTRGADPSSDEQTAVGMARRSWLRLETAMKRWNAILRDTTPADVTIDPETYTRVMQVRLKAYHDQIDSGDGDYNEEWNQALVTLLQRAGVVRVFGSSEADKVRADVTWRVEILDDSILQPAVAASPPWQRYAVVRQAERHDADAELDVLQGLLQGGGASCLLTGVFEAIDPETVGVQACGRCPNCRQRLVPYPGAAPANDVGKRWRLPVGVQATRDPAGLHVLTYDSPCGWATWLDVMVSAGVQQFLLAQADAAPVAAALAEMRVPLGLVTAWAPESRQAALGTADMPTTFVPPVDRAGEDWFDYVEACVVEAGSHPHYLIVRDGLRLRGRPLSQVASVHPPRTLEDFARTSNPTRAKVSYA